MLAEPQVYVNQEMPVAQTQELLGRRGLCTDVRRLQAMAGVEMVSDMELCSLFAAPLRPGPED